MFLDVASFAERYACSRRRITNHIYNHHSDDPDYPLIDGKRLILRSKEDELADELGLNKDETTNA